MDEQTQEHPLQIGFRLFQEGHLEAAQDKIAEIAEDDALYPRSQVMAGNVFLVAGREHLAQPGFLEGGADVGDLAVGGNDRGHEPFGATPPDGGVVEQARPRLDPE